MRSRRGRGRGREIEEGRTRVVGYVSILFLVLVLESSQSGVSTRGETLFLLLLCKRLEGRDDKVPSDC